MKMGAYLSGSSIIRCTSRMARVALRSDSTTGGPMVILGTKWPSMTSTWSMRHPAASSAAICSPRRAKSAERIDGRISTMDGTLNYNCGEEPVSRVAAGQAKMGGGYRQSVYYVFVFFPFERTGGIDQLAAGLQVWKRLFQDLALHIGEPRQVGLAQPPFDLGIARQGSGSRARRVDQNSVELRIER